MPLRQLTTSVRRALFHGFLLALARSSGSSPPMRKPKSGSTTARGPARERSGTPTARSRRRSAPSRRPGGTIRVLPGTYHEAIRVTANIHDHLDRRPRGDDARRDGEAVSHVGFLHDRRRAQLLGGLLPSAAGHDEPDRGNPRHQRTWAARTSLRSRRRSARGFWSTARRRRSRGTRSSGTRSATPSYQATGTAAGSTSTARTRRIPSTADHEQPDPGNTADPPAGSNAQNATAGLGGGIYVGYNSAPIITGNTIKTNIAREPVEGEPIRPTGAAS